MKNILVIAVHPDDETLGCGGTLLRHKNEGDAIHWLICTKISVENGFTSERVSQRTREIAQVAKMYDFDGVHHLGIPTMAVDSFSMSELVRRISTIVQKIQPDTVYLPFRYDAHSDHRKIYEAASACTKSFRYPCVKRVLMMETLSETEFSPYFDSEQFTPNVFVDISDYFHKKIEIMNVFESELAPHPFPRSEGSISALAKLRGAMSGCYYAESFCLVKEIL